MPARTHLGTPLLPPRPRPGRRLAVAVAPAIHAAGDVQEGEGEEGEGAEDGHDQARDAQGLLCVWVCVCFLGGRGELSVCVCGGGGLSVCV